ncbi:Uncharacterised protein [Mycobacterium tuberculosis]|nr:Uncharacterised protein [Mycobacterium tuberculosis]
MGRVASVPKGAVAELRTCTSASAGARPPVTQLSSVVSRSWLVGISAPVVRLAAVPL